MFARPRSKKSIPPPPTKRRKKTFVTEEINFDFDARADYLTGFHKRKVQRAKRAQEEAAIKAREERLAARKQVLTLQPIHDKVVANFLKLRNERREEIEAHIEAVNALLDEAKLPASDGSNGLEDEVWNGFADGDISEAIDHEAEYIDEDRYTIVTVEAVDVSKEGLRKIVEDGHENGEYDTEKLDAPLLDVEVKAESSKKIWPKRTKKKFRYESKAERKKIRGKQKAGNKIKADARRAAN